MGKAKLKSTDARAIRESGGTNQELAAKYGVSTSTIREIRRGRKWKSAGGPVSAAKPTGSLWEPGLDVVRAAIAALEVRGVWQDAAQEVGVSVPTLKAYDARATGAPGELSAAAERGRSSAEAADRATLLRVIECRRTTGSWADAAAAAGVTAARASGLRTKLADLRRDVDSAAAEGRRFCERSALETALEKIGTAKTWARVAHEMGVNPSTLTAFRSKHPDMDAKLRAAREAVGGHFEPGFVYVIQDGHGMIKVGRTVNVDNRLRRIMTGNSSGELTVLFSAEVANMVDVESMIHVRLDEFRVHGEWFNVDPDKAVSIAKDEVKKSSDGVQTRIL
ncbi:MAG: GIY-YIG nuclease family protein [Candidatus Nanopelagicales bacterium]|jgi:hypothetical protein